MRRWRGFGSGLGAAAVLAAAAVCLVTQLRADAKLPSPGTGEGARRAGEGLGPGEKAGEGQAPHPAFGHLLPKGEGKVQRHNAPARIVSLNVCTDQILVDLVAPSRIRALSWLATDPTLSAIADRAKAFPGVRDQAEEVLALDPDLVIAQEYSATATVSMLERLGRKVLMVPLATDFDGIRKSVRTIAAAVGETARGEAIVARFDARLAAVRPAATGRRLTALAWEVNSLTSGPRTLLDAAMTHCLFHQSIQAVTGISSTAVTPIFFK